MKAFCKKYLPWVLILIGVLRLLWEHFPGRLAFLHVLGSDHFGWVFWLCGIFGIVWLLLRKLGIQCLEGGDQQAVNSRMESGNFPLRRFF